ATALCEGAFGATSTADAALTTVVVNSTAIARIGGRSNIDVIGALTVSALNDVDATATSDASAATYGGSVAVVTLIEKTIASIEGSGTVDADTIVILAQSITSGVSSSTASMGGAVGNESSPTDTTGGHADTSTGSLTVGAAIAVTVLNGETLAYVSSEGGMLTLTSTGAQRILASSQRTSRADADGRPADSSSQENSVGVAIAVNVASTSTRSFVTGPVTLDTPSLSIEATMPVAGSFGATAMSGLSDSRAPPSVAGALAVNVAGSELSASILGDVTVTGAASLAASGGSSSSASALGSTESTASGVGASFALNVSGTNVAAQIADGATLTGATGLALNAQYNATVDSEATAGGELSSGSTGVAGAVATTISSNEVAARVGTGSALTVTGDFDATARLTSSSSAKADGKTGGSSVAVGAALAINITTDEVVATTERNLTTTGSMTFQALGASAGSAEAIASAAGASEETTDTSGTAGVDSLIAGEQSHAASSSADTTGAAGASEDASGTSVPSASSSSGPISVAAAIAVNVTTSSARATIPDGLTIDAGDTLTLRSSNNADGSATADGSAANTPEGSGTVGAAVAINVSSVTNEARVGVATVTAGALVLEALMTDVNGDTTHAASAESTSGASGGKISVAGSVAINIAPVTTRAIQDTGAHVTLTSASGGSRDVTFTAESTTSNDVTAAAGQDGGGKLGVGASVALNIASNDVTAELANGAALDNANDFSLTATSEANTETFASAGAGSTSAEGVSVGGAIATTIANNNVRARIGTDAAGDPLVISGSLAASAEHRGSSKTTADGSADGGKAAVGVALAINIVSDDVAALTDRDIEASGTVSFSALDALAGEANALASSAGSAEETASGETSQSVDGTVTAEIDHANSQASAGGAQGTTGTAPPSASSSDGKVSVAAAIAVNISLSSARATIPANRRIVAGGNLNLAASNNTDSRASADGAAAKGTDATVGAAVAVNYARITNEAVISHGATVNADGISLTAIMADVAGERVHASSAEATSGASGGKVGVAGSLPINIIENHTRAVIESGAVVACGSGDIILSAQSFESNIASASANTTASPSGKLGVGASIALNVITPAETRAEVEDGATLTGGNNIEITAASGRRVWTSTMAGASGGNAVAPSVAIAIVLDKTTARLGRSATGLTATGNVKVASSHASQIDTVADGNAKSEGIAVGAAVGVNVILPETNAEVARNLQGASVSVTSTSTVLSRIWVLASASGNSTSTTSGTSTRDADAEAGAQVNNNPNVGGNSNVPSSSTSLPNSSSQTNNASTTGGQQSGKSSTSIGVAAAIGVNVVTVENRARIADGLTVTGTAGDVSVVAEAQNDASARAIGVQIKYSGEEGKGGVGAALGLNVLTVTNEAHIGTTSTVSASDDIRVAAITPDGQRNDAVSWGFAAAGGKEQFAVAGSVAVNVVTYTTKAWVGQNTSLNASDSVEVTASAPMGAQTLALAGGLGKKAGIGAAVAVNVYTISTQAHLDSKPGAPVTVRSGGALLIGAHSSLAPVAIITIPAMDETVIPIPFAGSFDSIPIPLINPDDLPDSVTLPGISETEILPVTSLAISGSISQGNAAVSGSAVVDVFDFTTSAWVGPAADVQAGSVVIEAVDTTDINSGAGGLAVSKGQAGVGAGVLVTVIDKDTIAEIGAGSTFIVTGDVTVSAVSREEFFQLALFGAGANNVGVGASIVVVVMTPTTRASIEGANTTVHAGGNMTIYAEDTADKIEAYAAVAVYGGTAGIGPALITVVRTSVVEAYIGSSNDIEAKGATGLKVHAVQSLDLNTVSMGIAAAGTAAVAGSVNVNVLTNTTNAYIGSGTEVNLDNSGAAATQGVWVLASDTTTYLGVAGALAGASTAGVGAAVDVIVLTKDTTAWIGSGSTVNALGDVLVDAVSADDITSVSVGAAIGGTAAVIINAGVSVIMPTTRSYVASGTTAIDAGNVRVSASSRTDLGAGAGNLAGGGTAGIGTAAVVPIVIKVTEAYVGRGATITVNGTATGMTAHNGTFDSVASASSVPTATAIDLEGTSTNTRSQADFATTEHVPSVSTFHGLAVTATNIDDFVIAGTSIGFAGTVAANVGGAVNVLNVTTKAFIDSGATVTALDDQSVLVAAGDDFRELIIVATAGFSGTVSVAPGVTVVVAQHHTEAYIADGATVTADEDVFVIANAAEDVLAVAAGVAGSGMVGVGGSVAVLVFDNETWAHIGESTGATVTAGNSVLVRATDITRAQSVAGGVGIGLGGAGVGVSVGVITIDKDTRAYIGAHSSVTGLGDGLGDLTVYSGNFAGAGFATQSGFRGVAVQAASEEDVLNVAAAVGGGLYAGVAGGISVEVITSDTTAYIGNSAMINTAAGTTGSGQSVNVSAVNKAHVLGVGGGAGVGIAGVGGAIDVGVIRNDTSAYLGAGSETRARSNVDVNALSMKQVETVVISVAAGIVGVPISVSVWTVGTTATTTYSDGSSSSNALSGDGWDAQSQANGMTSGKGDSGYSSLLTSMTPSADSTVSANRLNDNTAGAKSELESGQSDTRVSGAVGDTVVPLGTVSGIRSGATVYAGGNVNVRADESLTFEGSGGTISGGAVAGGPTIIIANLTSVTDASIGANASITAGGDVTVYAGADEHSTMTAAAGSGGGVAFGAQVAVITSEARQHAHIDNGARIIAADDVTVRAEADRLVRTNSAGVDIGGVAAGVSVAVSNATGSTKATIGSAQIGQSTSGRVGSLTVVADSDTTASALTIGVRAGMGLAANGAVATAIASPGVYAQVGPSANITVTRNVTVESISRTTAESTAYGAAVSGVAINGAVATAHAKPTVTASVEVANLKAGGSVMVRARHNYDAGGRIADTGAIATARAGTGGVVAATGAWAWADSSAVVESYLRGTTLVNVGDALLVSSESAAASDAEVEGLSVGLIGVGASVATALSNGSNSAYLGGPDIRAAQVGVSAISADKADAFTVAGAGGLYAGSASVPVAEVKSSTRAYIEPNANIRALNVIPIEEFSGSGTGPSLPSSGVEGAVFKVVTASLYRSVNTTDGIIWAAQASVPVAALPSVTDTLTVPDITDLGKTVFYVDSSDSTRNGYYSVVLAMDLTNPSNPGYYPMWDKAAEADSIIHLTAQDGTRTVGFYEYDGWWQRLSVDDYTTPPAVPAVVDQYYRLLAAPEIYRWTDDEWVRIPSTNVASISREATSGSLVYLTTGDGVRGPGDYWIERGTVTVTAITAPEAKAEAWGVNAGKFAIGASVAVATVSPTAEAYFGSGSNIKGSALTVQAVQRVSDAVPSAKALAYGAVGALIGVNGSASTALNGSTVNAHVDDSAVLVADGLVMVAARNDSWQYAEANNVAIGGIAAGAAIAIAQSDSHTTAHLGRATVTASGLRITAMGTDHNSANTFAGSGAVLASVAGAAPSTDNKSTTTARLGNNATVTLLTDDGALLVSADHRALFNAIVSSNALGALSGSGAVVINNVNSTVGASVGTSATVLAKRIEVSAINRVDKPRLASDAPHVQGRAAGGATAAGAISITTVDLMTVVTVETSATLQTVGVASNDPTLILEARNITNVHDKVRMLTAGALAGTAANSTVIVRPVARVYVQDKATLLSSGSLVMTAWGEGSLSARVSAETYSGGSILLGVATVRATPNNLVDIGAAHVRAMGDLNLGAGRRGADMTGVGGSPYTLESRWDGVAASIIPLDKLDARSFFVAENRVRVRSGALLETARQANLAAEQDGGYTTAQAKSVSWASAAGDAINDLLGGSGSEQFAGHARSEAHGYVEVNGTVRTGLTRHQIVTISNYDYTDDTVTVVAPFGVSYTFGYKSVKSNLVEALTAAQTNLAKYGLDAVAKKFYEDEIVRLKAELAAAGFGETVFNTATGKWETAYVSKVVPVITFEPIWAEAGFIWVRADQLQGGGAFDSPGDAEIRIVNNTPLFVELKGATIPNRNGGLYFNGLLVTSRDMVDTLNAIEAERDNSKREPDIGSWNAIDPDVYSAPVTFAEPMPNPAAGVDPSIYIENTIADLSSLPATRQVWPNIEVLGENDGGQGIFNDGGTLTLKVNPAGQGSIFIKNTVRAKNLSIIAGGDVYIDSGSPFASGGEPAAVFGKATYGAYYTGWPTLYGEGVKSAEVWGVTGTKDIYFWGIYIGTVNVWGVTGYNAEYTKALTTPTEYPLGVYGDRIHISAEHVNVNGTIQSGREQYTLTINAATLAEARTRAASATSNRVYLETTSNLPVNRGFRLYYNIADQRFEVDELATSGGYVEIFGKVLNTNAGRIRVLGGYSTIMVSNETTCDVQLNRLDASRRGAGKLFIYDEEGGSPTGVDHAVPTPGSPYVTVYEWTADGVKVTTSNGQLASNVSATASSLATRVVSWDLVAGASGYFIERADSAGGTYAVVREVATDDADIAGGRISASDPTALQGVTYYYRVSLYTTGTAGATSDYQPRLGWRYGWTTMVTQNLKMGSYKQSGSWLGFIPDVTVDQSISWDWVVPTGVPVWEGSGPYYYFDETNAVPAYTYKYSVVNVGAVKITRQETGDYWEWTWWKIFPTHIFWRYVEATQGQKQLHTHTLEADRPISIQMFGHAEGSVTVNSPNSNVIIAGPVLSKGITSITAGGSITGVTRDAEVAGRRIILIAGTGIGTDSTPLFVNTMDPEESSQSSLDASTVAGNINIAEVSGRLSIDEVRAAGGGKVQLASPGSIVAGGNPTDVGRVAGGSIVLNAGGGIGTSADRPLILDSMILGPSASYTTTPSVSASATGDVYLHEESGDLWLNSLSTSGKAWVKVSSGSLYDANSAQRRDDRTYEQLRDGVWKDLMLVGANATAKINETIDALARQREAEYQQYWAWRNRQDVPSVYDPNFVVPLTAEEESSLRTFYTSQGMTVDQVNSAIATHVLSLTTKYRELHSQFDAYFRSLSTSVTVPGVPNAYSSDTEYRQYWDWRERQADSSVYDGSFVVTMTADETSSYIRVFQAEGMTSAEVTAALTALEATWTAEYHVLHGAFEDYFALRGAAVPASRAATGTPFFVYQPSDFEKQTITGGTKVWEEDELLNLIGAGILKPVTDTQVYDEDPNIQAAEITLLVAGSVGRSSGETTIAVGPGVTFTDDEKVALGAAERTDITFLADAAVNSVVTFNTVQTSPGVYLNTITRVSGSVFTSLTAGMTIVVRGNTGNATEDDEYYTIASATSTILTLLSTDRLAYEDGRNVSIIPIVRDPSFSQTTTLSAEVVFGDNGYTIVRTGGSSWNGIITDGSIIKITGSTENATGPGETYRVVSSTATTLTLTGAEFLTAGGPVTVEIAVGVRPTVRYILVENLDDFNVSSEGTITVSGVTTSSAPPSFVLLGSEQTMLIDTIIATGDVRLKSGQSIESVGTTGAVNVIAESVTLEAALGSIGTSQTPFYIDLSTGLLTARANVNVYVYERNATGTAGDLRLESVYARSGTAHLESDGSILDGMLNDFTKIAANRIELVADGGIGTSGPGYLDIDVPEYGGILFAEAVDDIWLSEVLGSMNIGRVRSQTGGVSLVAHLSILDANDPLDPSAKVLGNDTTLTARLGGIGLLGNDLEVDTAYAHNGVAPAAPGMLTSSSNLGNTYITETFGDLIIYTVTTTGDPALGGSIAFITNPAGRILNGRTPGLPNILSGRTWLFAAGDIGEPTKAIKSEVGYVEGRSAGGSIYLQNSGALTIGGVTGSYMGQSGSGLQAGGSIVVGSGSPITVDESITAGGQILIISADDSVDDSITVVSGVSLVTTPTAHAPLSNLTPGIRYYVQVVGGQVRLLDAPGGSVIDLLAPTDPATRHYLNKPGAVPLSVSFTSADVDATGNLITLAGFADGDMVTYSTDGMIGLLSGDSIGIQPAVNLNATTAIYLVADFNKLDGGTASIAASDSVLTAGTFVLMDATGAIAMGPGMQVTAATGYLALDAGADILVGPDTTMTAGADILFNAAGPLFIGRDSTVDAGQFIEMYGSSIVATESILTAGTYVNGISTGPITIGSDTDVTAETGGISLDAAGPLVVGTNSTLTAMQAVVLSGASIVVTDSVVSAGTLFDGRASGDVTISTDTTITALSGDLALRAGDNLTVVPSAVLKSSSRIILMGDTPDADPGTGSTMLLEGTYDAPFLDIFGGPDGDTITLRPVAITGETRIAGGGGSDRIM
ncbi:MAG: hypothetical protein U1E26_09770, partial [Coriobacteriia bacterium]|nr:hypothetical protein [Coriobacteriia bacterium]